MLLCSNLRIAKLAVFLCICMLSFFSTPNAFRIQSPNAKPMKSSVHRKNSRHEQFTMRWGLKTNAPTVNTPDGKALRDTVPFELRGFSLPLVVFSTGIILTASSFAGFFLNDGNSDGAVSSLGFVYGIPVFLIGLSLWYAELKPVEVITSEAGDRAWNTHASDTFLKIKQDVTRHRYGDDAHLDSTLDSLGLRIPGKKYPKLLSLTQEEGTSGQLIFTLTFQSLETPFKIWNEPDRVRRYCKFFGPNVKAEVKKVDGDKRIVALSLTTISSEEYEALLQQPIDSANKSSTKDTEGV